MNEKMILDITEEKTREFETYLYERENAGQQSANTGQI